ncbi:MAG: GNAT family N-acetyltransferase [Thermoguttaceae bacterium]|nr:GNAT family N-acetyltransferase [Planctomycetaceae bacterium]MBQ4143643.1 GNAT family N-acetyltransferase [Thermoguttaceae bacterium]
MGSVKNELLRVQLRWMKEIDLDSVYELEQKCSPTPWGPMEFADVLMHSNCVGLVVEFRLQIIGYLIYEMHENALKILNIAVLPEFRRKGVGSQLVARLACFLARHTRQEMQLSVRESNLSAQLFFRSLGFKAVSICRGAGEQEEDLYVMQYRHKSRVLPTEMVLN